MARRTEPTPGPWSVTRSPKGFKLRLSGGGWTHFAKIVCRMRLSAVENGEGLANAALICAAPDYKKSADASIAIINNFSDVFELYRSAKIDAAEFNRHVVQRLEHRDWQQAKDLHITAMLRERDAIPPVES